MAMRLTTCASTAPVAHPLTSSSSPSQCIAQRPTGRAGYGGLPLSQPDTLEELLPVLQRAWERPFSTRSDFARHHVEQIAVACCLGLLTVRHDATSWGRIWRITVPGLHLLDIQTHLGDIHHDIPHL